MGPTEAKGHVIWDPCNRGFIILVDFFTALIEQHSATQLFRCGPTEAKVHVIWDPCKPLIHYISGPFDGSDWTTNTVPPLLQKQLAFHGSCRERKGETLGFFRGFKRTVRRNKRPQWFLEIHEFAAASQSVAQIDLYGAQNLTTLQTDAVHEPLSRQGWSPGARFNGEPLLKRILKGNVVKRLTPPTRFLWVPLKVSTSCSRVCWHWVANLLD